MLTAQKLKEELIDGLNSAITATIVFAFILHIPDLPTNKNIKNISKSEEKSGNLRARYAKIVKTGVIISAVIILLFTSWLFGIVKIEGIWFVFPLIVTRISTVITAILCFSIVLFMQRKSTLKAAYYAILAVIFSMALYEFVWYNIAVAMKGLPPLLFPFAALLGWIFLGIREVYNIQAMKISLVLYGVYAVLMVLWVVTGFNYNYIGNTNFSLANEVLNVASNAAIAFGYAFHIGARK